MEQVGEPTSFKNLGGSIGWFVYVEEKDNTLFSISYCFFFSILL